MSGKKKPARSSKAEDRRLKRTRKVLLEAFLALLREKRYGQIRVSDIVARADVGRSTLYEHFAGKDDILLQSMSGIYDILSNVVIADADTARLTQLLQHFWDNRQFARDMFSGPSAALGPKHGTRHLANLIAEGMMAVLRAWMLGAAACPPNALARAVHHSAVASAAAFLTTRR
jgi:AcrR family transcriptional regulator